MRSQTRSLARAGSARFQFEIRSAGKSWARRHRRTSGRCHEEYQVGVARIDPEQDLSSVIRISQLDASQAILVPLEAAERLIEKSRANPLRGLEIEFWAVYGLRVDRRAALVGQEDSSPWHAQHQTINRCRPGHQIRMSAELRAAVLQSMRSGVST